MNYNVGNSNDTKSYIKPGWTIKQQILVGVNSIKRIIVLITA